MVLHVEPGPRRVSLLSVPRDLLIPIADIGRQDKINAAFTGGPGRVAKTIEQNFGIPVNHYLLVDFNGFKSIVDALDGIRIDFPFPSRDMNNQGQNMSGLDIRRAGCQRLNGTQALALARSRDFSYLRNGHWRWDPNGDLGRVRRQQAFLQAVLKKGLSQGLTNPLKANAFVGAVVGDLTKDKGMKVSEIVGTAARFRSFSPSSLETYTVPTEPLWVGKSYRGELLKQAEAQRIVAKFLGRPDPTATTTQGPDSVTVSTLIHVRNAVGVQGLAQRARDQLVQAGFRVADVGNASVGGLAVTRILYHPGEANRAQSLRSAIIGPSQVEESATVTAGELTLLLGSDFGGVRAGATSTTAPSTSAAPSGSTGAKKPGAKKPAAKKPALDLRDYDPRAC
jgi:LCP family protein required for cell wall assembly